MKRIAIWALALTLTLSLFAPGIAQAHTRVFPTDTTLATSAKRVSAGTKVTFSGRIIVGKKKCKARKEIQITRNRKRFATVTTNGRGKFSITKRVRKAGRYRAVYAGFAFGAHPHSHICSASSSNTVRIRVT